MAIFCAQYFTYIKALLQNMMNCLTKCFKRKETKVRIEFQGNLTQKIQLPQLDVSSSFPFPEQTSQDKNPLNVLVLQLSAYGKFILSCN